MLFAFIENYNEQDKETNQMESELGGTSLSMATFVTGGTIERGGCSLFPLLSNTRTCNCEKCCCEWSRAVPSNTRTDFVPRNIPISISIILVRVPMYVVPI